MEELKIKAANAQEAYRNADAKGKKILEDLFGKDALVPKDITDRIKTLEDALAAIGTPEGEIKDFFKKFENLGKDVVAYMKLKVIIEALNDGWKPTFKDGEWRYYPWFALYTKEEWDELSDEDKKAGVCFGGGAHSGAGDGFVYALSRSLVCECGCRLSPLLKNGYVSTILRKTIHRDLEGFFVLI